MMKLPALIFSSGIVVLVAVFLGIQISDRIYFDDKNVASSQEVVVGDSEPTAEQTLSYNPPSMDDLPEGPKGEAILNGYNLVNETHIYAEKYVGNQLSCTS